MTTETTSTALTKISTAHLSAHPRSARHLPVTSRLVSASRYLIRGDGAVGCAMFQCPGQDIGQPMCMQEQASLATSMQLFTARVVFDCGWAVRGVMEAEVLGRCDWMQCQGKICLCAANMRMGTGFASGL